MAFCAVLSFQTVFMGESFMYISGVQSYAKDKRIHSIELHRKDDVQFLRNERLNPVTVFLNNPETWSSSETLISSTTNFPLQMSQFYLI